jgi:hypothetical protein
MAVPGGRHRRVREATVGVVIGAPGCGSIMAVHRPSPRLRFRFRQQSCIDAIALLLLEVAESI